ncbi:MULTISPECIES: DUF4287 domain-containing protein [Nocardiopsis]|uniref:DUF4287 domain-containing protein n=2 Tax=Nocardiopsis alba TaxID=53437 RepID=A0A7K2IUL8_9ACTN|nr:MULTISPECIES: DUF4287 domain-containing protein [Nocardiopsis]AFR09483.1 hypothetical protein B005_2870 [Nocardiopsis alba ATCC BAA-2165]MEC3895227.1 DUF4287 domain-containing protein [Nocardiopsis sp. LDBS1602]MYR33660.1 DUF4287 domain-containing protein [Nocardiopsis alba]
MSVAHSPEIHAKLIERIPVVTGRGLHEWFDSLDQGPGLLRKADRTYWLADEYGLTHGYARAIVTEYDRRRRDRSIPAPRRSAT